MSCSAVAVPIAHLAVSAAFGLTFIVCLFVSLLCSQSLEADPVVDELEGTQKAVQQAYSICQKGSVSHTDLQTSIRDLYDALQ